MSLRSFEDYRCGCHRGLAVTHCIPCRSPCQLCGRNIVDLYADRHAAECHGQGRETLEDLIFGRESRYLTALNARRDLQAELVVAFDRDLAAIRSFVARLAACDEIADSLMGAIAEVAADRGLLARTRGLQQTFDLLR